MPPIYIGCDLALGKFKMKRRECNGLNMFVTWEKIVDELIEAEVDGSMKDVAPV